MVIAATPLGFYYYYIIYNYSVALCLVWKHLHYYVSSQVYFSISIYVPYFIENTEQAVFDQKSSCACELTPHWVWMITSSTSVQNNIFALPLLGILPGVMDVCCLVTHGWCLGATQTVILSTGPCQSEEQGWINQFKLCFVARELHKLSSTQASQEVKYLLSSSPDRSTSSSTITTCPASC